MWNKIMTALVVASIACWSAPTASAALNRQPGNSRTQDQQSARQHHSCCPGFHSNVQAFPVAALSPVPAMPCGDRHPCCAQQAPESPAAVTAISRVNCSGNPNSFATSATQNLRRTQDTSPKAYSINFSLAFLQTTVLRI